MTRRTAGGPGEMNRQLDKRTQWEEKRRDRRKQDKSSNPQYRQEDETQTPHTHRRQSCRDRPSERCLEEMNRQLNQRTTWQEKRKDRRKQDKSSNPQYRQEDKTQKSHTDRRQSCRDRQSAAP